MFVWGLGGFFFNFLLQYAICIPSQRWLCYAAMWQPSAVTAESLSGALGSFRVKDAV